MMKFIQKIILLVLMLSVAGCGYHLRGSGAGKLNVNKVYLQIQNVQLIVPELREQLTIRDVQINPSSEGTDRIVKLSNEQYDRRVLSVDEGTGKVTEYELEYHVWLEILTSNGRSLAEPQDISLIRDITFDPNAAVGKFDEEILVRDDMIRSVANSILLRLQALE